MKKNFLLPLVIIMSIVVGIFIILSLLIYTQHQTHSQYYTQYLPKNSLGNLQEYEWKDALLPDYEYYLKVSLKRKEFEIYCNQLSLQPYSQQHRLEHMSITCEGIFSSQIQSWWQCKQSIDSAFIWVSSREYNVARYENGYLYFYACRE